MLMYSSLDNKGLLNFHRPFPLLLFNSNEIVKIIGLRSLQNEAKAYALITVSCKTLEIKSNPVFCEYGQKHGFDEE